MTPPLARDPSPNATFKFPAFQPDLLPTPEEDHIYGHTSSRSASPSHAAQTNGSNDTRRQKSLSEAFRTIRTPKGSVSQNAHELADALKAPLSPKPIVLCGVWYMTSIFTNMSSKAILTALPKPITLTTVQFAFVSGWCLILAMFARKYPRLKQTMPFLKYGIRAPSKELIMATLPLTCFQIGGHILSADATSRIPVSIFFKIQYSLPTYLSLIPLTLGVILACSADFNANLIGLMSAFASAILFVVQKHHKLNLLCYSSGLAFLFTLPLWLWSEGFTLIFDFLHDASIELSDHPEALDHGRLLLEFLFNGTFHFGQNIVAFVLLSMVSPVTYSVASLIKRVFVIVFAVVWFGKPMTKVQAFGFVLTFVGLYLYDRTHDAAKADKRAKALQSKNSGSLLPLATDVKSRPVYTASPSSIPDTGAYPMPGFHESREEKRHDDSGSSGYRRTSEQGSHYLPPGTKAEDTWRPNRDEWKKGYRCFMSIYESIC
ncbi:unnamed protein product [Alternaria alternata]